MQRLSTGIDQFHACVGQIAYSVIVKIYFINFDKNIFLIIFLNQIFNFMYLPMQNIIFRICSKIFVNTFDKICVYVNVAFNKNVS